MKYKPQGTLSWYKSAPQFHRVDLSHVPTIHFSTATKLYREDCGQTSPDTDALTFYTYNHLFSIIQQKFTAHEPLPTWANELSAKYLKAASSQGNRMLHYILSICTREMRHLKKDQVTATTWKKGTEDFGEGFITFLKDKICTATEDNAVKHYMTTPPDMPIGLYIKGLAYFFHSGKWNGGYGGKAWGAVADACVSFIHGKTSMEALIDTGFTLAHNNGPIFNKNLLYTMYTSHFKTILDIQRSGQIPELLLDKDGYGIPKPAELVANVKIFALENPSSFRGWVDWVDVEAKGALGSYYSYIEKQKKTHPMAEKPMSKNIPVLATEDSIFAEDMGLTFGAPKKMVWQVLPNLSVEKFVRVKS